ncbi:MAG: hypothetical protein ABJO27_21310 [Pseudoruegeria sp.]
MAVKDFDQSPFISLREAFEIVGKASLGDDWNEGVFEKDAQSHERVLSRVRNILRSGDVAAHWHTADHQASGELQPVEVDHEFFSIRLSENTVFHYRINEPVLCRIHAKQLHSCLLDLDLSQTSFTSVAEKECFHWFVEYLNNTEDLRLKVVATEELARKKFPKASKAGITRARREAVAETGKHGIFRAGRPKI